ncbi:MAG: ABC transporter substrate-binding protein [Acidobacteria bacterium]|nr:ABC transporter substrate-binding protein [Acidobacteriota bacterium]
MMPSDFSPRRVVCLQPSATVTLAGLGMLDRVVACTKYCVDVCPEATRDGRTIVADSWTAKAQEIMAARPDLVIAAVPYQVKALAEILKAGVPFLGLAPRTLADVYGDLARIAGLMQAPERGRRMIDDMQREVEAVRRAAVEGGRGPRPRVFCEEWGKPIIHSQPWVAELVEAAGGEFLGDPGKQTDADTVCRAGPEVIIAAWCGAGDRVPLERMIAERGWKGTSAARAGRVYCIPDEYLNTPATPLVLGLKALAWAIHPEIFPQAPPRVRKIAVV